MCVWWGGDGVQGAASNQQARPRPPARLLCLGRLLHAALERCAVQMVDKQRRASAEGQHARAERLAALLALLGGEARRLLRAVLL